MNEINKRAWLEIDLKALEENYKNLRKPLKKETKFMAVVKSNAYGHGAVLVAKHLESLGADAFAVATIDEGIELRENGVTKPILILGYTPAFCVHQLIKYDITAALGSLQTAKEYKKELQVGEIIKVHVKLETGMGRTGFNVKDGETSDILEALSLDCFDLQGVFSHCSMADVDGREDYQKMQFEVFNKAVEKIENAIGARIPTKHISNSATYMSYPEMELDMVRFGIILYGDNPTKDVRSAVVPFMSLKTRVVQINEVKAGEYVGYAGKYRAERDMKVAVMTIGYGDGLHRLLSNKLEVLIRGKRCKQIGNICMDMAMIDVSSLDEIQINDIVTIIGSDGDEEISIIELAEKAQTITYELFCGFTNRLERAVKSEK